MRFAKINEYYGCFVIRISY